MLQRSVRNPHASVKVKTKDFPVAPDFHYPDFQYVLQMKEVHVHYEGKQVLEGINWEVDQRNLLVPDGSERSRQIDPVKSDYR